MQGEENQKFQIISTTGKKLCITIDKVGPNFFCHMGEENFYEGKIQGDLLLGYHSVNGSRKGWWIDIIKMVPSGQGYGSLFLQTVLANLKIHPQDVHVCASSENSERFYVKNGIGHLEMG